ncbi:hypothetical protein B7494_g998 [Chlorociboria aeruginascens]|nr:hypothetical protein B7494_g998 [Chlorociboria aeruginascens]
MTEPPYKRARRTDSKTMWEESEQRIPAREREDPRDRRDTKRREDRDRDRDRDRRYRSRSPRDSRVGRERARGGRDEPRDSKGGRDQRDGRSDRRGTDRDARSREERQPRDRPRERSKPRDKKRRSRSRSPKREKEQEIKKDIDTDREKTSLQIPEEESMERNTPPVSFKVGYSHDTVGQYHDHMELDEDTSKSSSKVKIKGKGKSKVVQEPEQEDDIIVEDDSMAAMEAMMGFGGFGTTHQKKVAGNNVSATIEPYERLMRLRTKGIKYIMGPKAVLLSFGRAADDAGDPSILSAEIARNANQSLLWGPYRPNVYFGVRPRIPKSFMGGLMWTRVDNFQDVQNNFRHTCEQGDGMAGYGWEEFDSRRGGQQTIYDKGNGIDIKTMFVKVPGGSHGGSWAARVRGTVRKDGPSDLKTTIIFYAGIEGLGSLEVEEVDMMGYEGDVTLKGESEGLGQYKVVVTGGRGFHPKATHPSYAEKPLDRTIVQSAIVPENILWQSKPILFQSLKAEIDRYLETYGEENAPPPEQVYTIKNSPGTGNLHMIQKVFEGNFEFDIIFNSGSAPKELSSQDVSIQIGETSKAFWAKFMETFDLMPPFDIEKLQRFSSNMFSNLLGGLGYFYGDSVVDRSYAPEYDEENEGFWEEAAEARGRRQEKLEGPSQLFTTVPSRPFFPRGFLWDEGFHLMPIAEWDMDLTLEIVKSWFDLIDQDGWIGREQILGAEARSKVPPEFQTQYPHYANPPTLFFIIDTFIEKLGALNGTAPQAREKLTKEPTIYSAHLQNPEIGLKYLEDIYPKLRKHYFWFRKTQSGDLKSYDRDAFSSKEAYRWRGRTATHLLTSGLDDYPRPQPPHPGELHVDLISWMGMMTKSLKNIATLLNLPDDIQEFSSIETAILRNIDDLHWSEKEKCYCDATIDDYEENFLVCHKGYISLFPFLTGLIEPESEKLGHVLNLLGDEEELWSQYGIRSLSKKNEFYGTGENYWRGPIWMNMNYLAVTQLLKYAKLPGPHQEKSRDLYTQLRLNLIKTVYESWAETGFAWEQYNPETGKGQRTQHFTGWTALVVKIMGMEDLSGGKYKYEGAHDEL